MVYLWAYSGHGIFVVVTVSNVVYVWIYNSDYSTITHDIMTCFFNKYCIIIVCSAVNFSLPIHRQVIITYDIT